MGSVSQLGHLAVQTFSSFQCLLYTVKSLSQETRLSVLRSHLPFSSSSIYTHHPNQTSLLTEPQNCFGLSSWLQHPPPPSLSIYQNPIHFLQGLVQNAHFLPQSFLTHQQVIISSVAHTWYSPHITLPWRSVLLCSSIIYPCLDYIKSCGKEPILLLLWISLL